MVFMMVSFSVVCLFFCAICLMIEKIYWFEELLNGRRYQSKKQLWCEAIPFVLTVTYFKYLWSKMLSNYRELD